MPMRKRQEVQALLRQAVGNAMLPSSRQPGLRVNKTKKKEQQGVVVATLLLQENVLFRPSKILLLELSQNVAFHVETKAENFCAHGQRLNSTCRIVVAMQKTHHYEFSPIFVVLTKDPYLG